MSNVIKFPKVVRPATPAPVVAVPPAAKNARSPVAIAQIVIALLWPILRWVMALDVTWQLFKVMYYWNTPGEFAGLRFLAHFAVFVGLWYFVACYRPKR